MAYPSAILVREKALLIHLESIRMVISKDAVYVLTIPSSEDRHIGILPTADAPFIKDLIQRINESADVGKQAFSRSAPCLLIPVHHHMRLLPKAGHVCCHQTVKRQVCH